MLSYFIEVNSLEAKIIPRRLLHRNGAKCELFFADNRPVLAIFSAKKEIELKMLKKVLSCKELHDSDAVETERVTGYKKGFLPPISIYGPLILLDKSLEDKDKLYFFVGENETLEIPLQEILDFNEEVVKGSFTL